MLLRIQADEPNPVETMIPLDGWGWGAGRKRLTVFFSMPTATSTRSTHVVVKCSRHRFRSPICTITTPTAGTCLGDSRFWIPEASGRSRQAFPRSPSLPKTSLQTSTRPRERCANKPASGSNRCLMPVRWMLQ